MLVDSLVVPDHVLKLGRREVRLQNVGLADLKELFSKSSVSEAVAERYSLLMSIGSLWGPESLGRFQFADAGSASETSKLALMMQGFRR